MHKFWKKTSINIGKCLGVIKIITLLFTKTQIKSIYETKAIKKCFETKRILNAFMKNICTVSPFTLCRNICCFLCYSVASLLAVDKTKKYPHYRKKY